MQLINSSIYICSLFRLPIVDEKAPKEENLDDILNVLRQQGPDTACIFNCQMGKGRTTTGMIIACLIKGCNTNSYRNDSINLIFSRNVPIFHILFYVKHFTLILLTLIFF